MLDIYEIDWDKENPKLHLICENIKDEITAQGIIQGSEIGSVDRLGNICRERLLVLTTGKILL